MPQTCDAMALETKFEPEPGTPMPQLTVAGAAAATADEVCAALASTRQGLTTADAQARLISAGPNALRSHGARPGGVLLRQLQSPLLLLLVVAAAVSATVGEGTGAAIIAAIVALSVGLGFFNEYRSERAVEALHSRIRHTSIALRDGSPRPVDVTDLVPGDIVMLDVGDVVPADLRLLAVTGLECDEAVLTGESLPSGKVVDPTPGGRGAIASMGTVVSAGTGTGIVVATGTSTEFGRIALRLGDRLPVTAFQLGLRDFSLLLVRVTFALTAGIFIINTALHRPIIDALLFSLAIAVGLTPQLLPAIVTISLATGASRLAKRSVIVKRLVSIEDLGNISVLFTDKTGTLTQGQLSLTGSFDQAGAPSDAVLQLGLLCNAAVIDHGVAVGGNPLDRAIWAGAADQRVAAHGTVHTTLPFDYGRRMMSVLAGDDEQTLIITKGAPEAVFERCTDVPRAAQQFLEQQFDAGARVVAIATRRTTASTMTLDDEHDLTLAGFLTFLDPPKPDAAVSLERLVQLGVAVKIITGDNARVAQRLATDLNLPLHGVLSGSELDELSDPQLTAALTTTDIFARVSPEQKSRIIAMQRAAGTDVGFLGDGVNDAVALRTADVGISVETATDVAKDAADIVLTDKDLGILADGIVEGRRIFANTIKYVLMGTSSNFGNMFSAAGGSLVLPFLPMLPTQILLNNMLYDISEMTIPTDEVDAEMLRKPSQWDIHFIRRFMIVFGPISSLYDFLTFAVMLWVFHADASLFHSGWFVESLATQSLVIFVIRTRRIPFLRSRPSTPLLLTTLACSALGAWIPFSPIAQLLGFRALPLAFLGIVLVMIVTYLTLVQIAVALFFHRPARPVTPLARSASARDRRVHRIATRWSHPGEVPHRRSPTS